MGPNYAKPFIITNAMKLFYIINKEMLKKRVSIILSIIEHCIPRIIEKNNIHFILKFVESFSFYVDFKTYCRYKIAVCRKISNVELFTTIVEPFKKNVDYFLRLSKAK